MAFVISVPISLPVPIPRFPCRGLQMALVILAFIKIIVDHFHRKWAIDNSTLNFEFVLTLIKWRFSRVHGAMQLSFYHECKHYNFFSTKTWRQFFYCQSKIQRLFQHKISTLIYYCQKEVNLTLKYGHIFNVNIKTKIYQAL